jgi:predicted RNase H-like HicB family nuclease
MTTISKKRPASWQFTLDYWKDDGWFVGRLREVPAACSQGETLDELVENIRDAYQMIIRESKTTLPTRRFQSKKVSLVH